MGRSTDACHKTFCQQAESLLFNELGHVAIWIGLLRHCKTFKSVCHFNTDDISKETWIKQCIEPVGHIQHSNVNVNLKFVFDLSLR